MKSIQKRTFLTENHLESVRLKSAVIQNTSSKYPLYQRPISRNTSERVLKDPHQTAKMSSPILRYETSHLSPNIIPYFVQHRQEKHPTNDCCKQGQIHLQKFQVQQKQCLQKYQSHLRECLNDEKTFKKSFYRKYHEESRKMFKKRTCPKESKTSNTPSRHPLHPTVQRIMAEEEEQRRTQQNKRFTQTKKQKDDEDDRQDKQRLADLMAKFMAGEQKYFKVLDGIKEQSGKKFEHSMLLKDTYHFDNLIEPQEQFLSYKDLQYQREKLMQKQKHPILMRQNDNNLLDLPINMGRYLQDELKLKQDKTLRDQLLQKEKCQNMNPDNLSQAEQFWASVKTGNKRNIPFMLIVEPDLLKLRDQNGMTALHWAAQRNYTRLAIMLIKRGMSFTDVDAKGRTPKSIAKQLQNQPLLDLIRHIEIENNLLLIIDSEDEFQL